MFERKLFLGLQADDACHEALLTVDKRLLELFIGEKEEFLQRFTYQNQLYLGRFVEAPIELSKLDLLQEHIFSLLKRLLPNFSWENFSLRLLPVVNVKSK